MGGPELHDIFVIGGGINGCGIARDAVGRGYSVYLAEMDDLASGTSSFSTKLIHGGLRYLEHYEFRLVREALMEREVLWKNAPHIIWPMRFVLPHAEGLRPAWLLRLGLFLYDHIGGRKLLPATRTLDMRSDPAGKPLKPMFKRAFEYSDGWVNDARLVILNARDAADRGATIRTRTEVTAARRENGHWVVTTENLQTGTVDEIKARLIVNAAGPWVDHVLAEAVGQNVHNVRLVQGSHIVVRKKFDDPRAYFFQNRDGRIIFAIPYEDDFTLIGTTDQDYDGDPRTAKISQAEINYLCDAASEYFAEPVKPEHIVWTYSGVRPLYDDGASKAQEATRDYVLKSDGRNGEAPVVNIFGGKITTYRRLAESMIEIIEKHLGRKGAPWTASAALPGGEFEATAFDTEVAKLKSAYPFLDMRLARRLTRLYGTRAKVLLGLAKSEADLGRNFGADLYEAEVRYLVDNEWAVSADDVLWRRTKRGLKLGKDQAAALEEFLQGIRPGMHNAAAE
ncbi:MAG: glycerol-3-phosphate dehydrogenase [Methylobacterium sp. SCN 67-24]|nr:MAG: glycerol-3-phosphate dehydrogenase [Methylobacterium sp. SCN 67-24]